MSRHIANLINRLLAPFGVMLIPRWEMTVLKQKSPRLDFFLKLAQKSFRPKHIIDVGANLGNWSRDAHQIFHESAFTLIEPQIEMRPYLDKVCAEIKNAHWILAGAGELEGELALTIGSRHDSSSFAVSEEAAFRENRERRIVPVVTLDAVCSKSPYQFPDMVKIDAEGLDLAVMRGARKLIGVTELFFLEVPLLEVPLHSVGQQQTFHSMLEFMKENGYEPYDFTEFIPATTSDHTLGAVEIAFAKRDGVLRSSL